MNQKPNMEDKNKVICIAEVGHNWGKDLEMAKELIWSAKECGADIVKFQLYDIDKIKKPWDNHYQELKDSQLTEDQLWQLVGIAKKANIEFMASAFDVERVRWLEEMDVKRHKIASRSIYDQELIKAMLDTEKPIIASLGAWNGKKFPRFKADFLYCLTRKQVEEQGVKTFPTNFDEYAGFSDHTIGLYYTKLAIERGAKIIEKHFTFDKNMAGCDQAASMEPEELKELVNHSKNNE